MKDDKEVKNKELRNRGKNGMMKKVMIAVGTIVIITLLGTGVYHSSASQATPELSADTIRQMVTDQYPGTITEMELEKEHNKVVYEVEVLSDGKEYDLKLDGNTGEVIKLEEKIVKKTDNADQPKEKVKEEADNDQAKIKEKSEEKSSTKKSKTNNKTETKKAVIDAKEAIEIALKEFPGTVTEFELDEEDGRLIYEIEIESGHEEAEIEIDAYTGEVLVIEIDD